MQFQVPQFIETEDKIVGPLTIRQFLYVGGALGLSFVLFFTVNIGVWFVLSVVIVGAAGALAFVKINGRSLTQVILAALRFYWQPQVYVWQPENPKASKEETLESSTTSKLSIEDIMTGAALKSVWRNLQTGSKGSPRQFEHAVRREERYQIFRRESGERRAARRIDYR